MNKLKKNLAYIGAGLLCFIVVFASYIFVNQGSDGGVKYMDSMEAVFKIITGFFAF